jgi:hypothetical protein
LTDDVLVEIMLDFLGAGQRFTTDEGWRTAGDRLALRSRGYSAGLGELLLQNLIT